MGAAWGDRSLAPRAEALDRNVLHGEKQQRLVVGRSRS